MRRFLLALPILLFVLSSLTLFPSGVASEPPRESDGSSRVPKLCRRTSGKGLSLAGEAESADLLGLLLDLASLST